MRAICIILGMLTLGPVAFSAETVTFSTGEGSFDIEFVEIGDPGNVANASSPQGLGSVDYTYSIAKFEVSREMIDAAGLNIVLYPMDDFGGPLPDMPATGLTWFEAVRFVEWLNKNQDSPRAYRAGGTALSSPGIKGFNPDNPLRSTLAKFALPTSDEIYKAGFYDPDANNGDGGYWKHAAGSDEAPFPVAWGTSEDTAVYDQPAFDPPAGIDVAGGLSPFGVMAIGGNAAEYEETAWDGVNDMPAVEAIGVTGGFWFGDEEDIMADSRVFTAKQDRHATVGFRVVMLPDPVFDLGDVNLDSLVDAMDIDDVADAILDMDTDPIFDLNEDGAVDTLDRIFLVEDILGTHFGDVNLNNEVEFDDFLALAAGFDRRGGWEDGDVDGNERVDFDDFLILAANFGLGGEVAAAAVPEPSSALLGFFAFLTLGVIRRRR